MAEVHNNREVSTGGIKLFGKTITLQEMRKVKEEKEEEGPQKIRIDDQEDINKNRPDKIIACPRCKSMETKFCYFNNYNVNQPRHFCRGCQRYWTAGGALRNVPVGAGRRKTKPPCRGFPEECGGLFDASTGVQVQQLIDFDGMVEEWQNMAAAEGDFRHVFPAKRRRSISGGESC